jgi:hypothetical protein
MEIGRWNKYFIDCYPWNNMNSVKFPMLLFTLKAHNHSSWYVVYKTNNFIFTVTLWRQDVTVQPVISNSWFHEGALSDWQRSYRQCDIQMSLSCHVGHTLRVLYPLYCKQSDWWVRYHTAVVTHVAHILELLGLNPKWAVPVPIYFNSSR